MQARRLVAPATKAAALAQYLEGVGQRATERLLGVSHNSITNWVKKAVAGQVLQATPAQIVTWVEADELWTYVAKKKRLAGSGGLLIVLPSAFWAGRWGIVEPRLRSGWMRNFLTPPTSPSPRISGTPTEKSSTKTTTSKAKPTPSPSKACTTASAASGPGSNAEPTVTASPRKISPPASCFSS